jgi:hypothetical protein
MQRAGTTTKRTVNAGDVRDGWTDLPSMRSGVLAALLLPASDGSLFRHDAERRANPAPGRDLFVKPRLKPARVPPAAAPRPRALARLRDGYSLALQRGPTADLVTLQAADGRLLLRIALGPDGPQVEVQTHALTVSTTGPLRVDCERFEVEARQEIALRAPRIVQNAEGGDLVLSATEDVRVDGTMVRINSPK